MTFTLFFLILNFGGNKRAVALCQNYIRAQPAAFAAAAIACATNGKKFTMFLSNILILKE